MRFFSPRDFRTAAFFRAVRFLFPGIALIGACLSPLCPASAQESPSPELRQTATRLLYAAAFKGELDSVTAALMLGADINAINDTKLQQTALMAAAYKGQEAIVKLLLEKGANPAQKDADGHTALDYARASGNAAVIGLLTNPAKSTPTSRTELQTEDAEREDVSLQKAPPKSSPLTPRPGYVIGRAVFADGRPIPKFTVVVGGFDGNATFGGGIPTVGYEEATNGTYAVQTKDSFSRKTLTDARVVTIQAYALLPYQGKEYKLALYPADGKADTTDNGKFIGQSGKGLVRDFILRLSGTRPGYEGEVAEDLIRSDKVNPIAFYGGTVRINLGYKSEGGYENNLKSLYPAGSTVAVTLTPEGPLADGSQGRVITRRVPPGKDANYSFALQDIPLGVYTATAQVIEQNGTTRPLRVNSKLGDYKSSVRLIFTPSTLLTGGMDSLYLYIGR